MLEKKADYILHISFKIGIFLKGIYGLIEIVGGCLMIFMTPPRLTKIIILLTREELSEDPKDIIANAVLKFSGEFSISTEYFILFYLISHGIIKVILVLLLWQKKLWAYPLAIVFLGLFVCYQIYQYFFSHSLMLILLTVLDLIVIALTVFEYNRQNIKSL